MRITLRGQLGNARLYLQVGIGTDPADAFLPAELTFPTLLGDPPIRLGGYPIESTIAEKYHAIVALGRANSRMKDFFDISDWARRGSIDPHELGAALTATFAARSTPLPAEPLPPGDEFASDPDKLDQWSAFCARVRIADPPTLQQVCSSIRELPRPLARRPDPVL